jgi:hypothetical protein
MVDQIQGLVLPTRGAWTPVLTAATPGDLNVAYSTQIGRYSKFGRYTTLWWNIATSTFTRTTAAGALQITGSPFTADSLIDSRGLISYSGITKATFTDFYSRIVASSAIISFVASASGVGGAVVNITDLPSGGSVVLYGSLTFEADS